MSFPQRLEEQIARARARLDFDLQTHAAKDYGSPPAAIATTAETDARRGFLAESLQQPALADLLLERILAGNELQPINYLARGTRAAEAVARIAMRDPVDGTEGWGTGFLIAPEVLLTNHHVLAHAQAAAASQAQFHYEIGADGGEVAMEEFGLEPERLFLTDPALDFTVVAVAGGARLATLGYLPLLSETGKALEGEWLTITQHPRGERKQIAVRENRLIKKSAEVLWYTTDTTPGSSGSPVMNNDWFVVALHHSGVPAMRDGRIQTLDGTDWDGIDETRVKWEANEGIRASVIANALKRALPEHPLLQPMYRATPESARIAPSAAPTTPRPTASPATSSRLPSMNTGTLTVPLQIRTELQPDGSLAVVDAQLARAATESASTSAAEMKKPKAKPPAFDAPFDADYSTRGGYRADFLGKAFQVNLPRLSDSLERVAARLIKPVAGEDPHVLRYHNFSLVLHRDRRLALYSAANVRFGQRYDMGRPADVWREDPRIDRAAQLTGFYYRNNRFDRGHLTRREDLEYGPTPVAALASAADTCHWTNCTPQHERFNQGKELWQGLERHILEEAVLQGQIDVQVMTGPLLEEDDPVFEDFPEIPYPVRFWKVVATLDRAKKPFATAFLMDQSATIKQYGLREAEVPITPYKTYQVPIAEVERLTLLQFTADAGGPCSLSVFDPLGKGVPEKLKKRRARLPVQPAEAMVGPSDEPANYHALDRLEAVYLG